MSIPPTSCSARTHSASSRIAGSGSLINPILPKNDEVDPEEDRPHSFESPIPQASVSPGVSVLILAYNNLSDTIECLVSVSEIQYANLDVLVVDNGSTDGSADAIRDHFPNVRVLRSESNLGVPGGFNLGIRNALASGSEFVFLLNNDTVVAPDIVSILVARAIENPNLAIVMPKILYYDQRDLVWSVGARYRRVPPAIVFIGLGKPDRDFQRVQRIQYAPSCGLLVRRGAFERVGLFDDGYRFYYDDWDFSIRVREAGFAIELVPAARMWHKVSRTIRKRRDEFWKTWGASAARFYRRHGHPAAMSLPVHIGYIVGRELIQGNGRSLPFFFVGLIHGLSAPLEPFPQIQEARTSRGT